MSFIFLSYAREDQKIAEEVSEILRRNNVEVWMDRLKILPGQRWDKHIQNAIENCSGAILLVSQYSLRKDSYIQREIDALLERAARVSDLGVFLIILRVQDIVIDDPRIQSFHWVDFFGKERSSTQEFEKVIRATWQAGEDTERSKQVAATDESPPAEAEYKLAKGTIGKLFEPKEVNLYIDKGSLEAFIYHDKVIDYDKISHLIYVPEDYSIVVVQKDSTRLDLGVKLRWLIRPYFSKASEVFIVQTKDGESIDGRGYPMHAGIEGSYGTLFMPSKSTRLGRFFRWFIHSAKMKR